MWVSTFWLAVIDLKSQRAPIVAAPRPVQTNKTAGVKGGFVREFSFLGVDVFSSMGEAVGNKAVL